MSVWDWMFVFYLSAVATVGTMLWFCWSRNMDIPKEQICDGCGQVCTLLRDGFCVYCDKHFTPTSKKPLP
jgi:hypothetical protein